MDLGEEYRKKKKAQLIKVQKFTDSCGQCKTELRVDTPKCLLTVEGKTHKRVHALTARPSPNQKKVNLCKTELRL